MPSIYVVRRNEKIIRDARSVPCADCGGKFPWYVMEFDHCRGVKLRNVGDMRNASKTKLLAEIEKCDVVCANCHRIRTHFDRDCIVEAPDYISHAGEI